jgi:hypothetical protein
MKPGDLDLSTLQKFLPNVNFPASKEEIASTAESNNAPQELVQQIRNTSVERFNSLGDVHSHLTPGGDHPPNGPSGNWTGEGPDDL